MMARPRRPAGSNIDPGEREGSKESDNASGSGEGATGTAEEGDEDDNEEDEEIVNLDKYSCRLGSNWCAT